MEDDYLEGKETFKVRFLKHWEAPPSIFFTTLAKHKSLQEANVQMWTAIF